MINTSNNNNSKKQTKNQQQEKYDEKQQKPIDIGKVAPQGNRQICSAARC